MVKGYTADELNPDFVITGGDLIMDALGNHKIFGLYSYSSVNPPHPEYGKKIQKSIEHSSLYSGITTSHPNFCSIFFARAFDESGSP